jgi:hypothetical protein
MQITPTVYVKLNVQTIDLLTIQKSFSTITKSIKSQFNLSDWKNNRLSPAHFAADSLNFCITLPFRLNGFDRKLNLFFGTKLKSDFLFMGPYIYLSFDNWLESNKLMSIIVKDLVEQDFVEKAYFIPDVNLTIPTLK